MAEGTTIATSDTYYRGMLAMPEITPFGKLMPYGQSLG
jgi:hypothetical protein